MNDGKMHEPVAIAAMGAVWFFTIIGLCLLAMVGIAAVVQIIHALIMLAA